MTYAAAAKGQDNKSAQTSSSKKATTNNGGGKPKKFSFQGSTEGLEKYTFFYGTGMAENCLKSTEALLNYIGKKYSMSESKSLEQGRAHLIGIVHPPKYNQAEYDALEFWEKKQWELDMKRYSDAIATLRKNLTACYAIIWGQMTITLKNQIKSEAGFKAIQNTSDGPSLLKLVLEISNRGSTIDHFPTRIVDTLMSLLQLHGDNFTNLSEYYDNFASRSKFLFQSGVSFQFAELEDFLKAKTLAECNNDRTNSVYLSYIGNMKRNCNQQIASLIFLHNSGKKYEELRRDLRNNFNQGTDKLPTTIHGAFNIVSHFESTNLSNNKGKNKNNSNNNKSSETTTQDENKNNNTKANMPNHSFQQESNGSKNS